MSSVIPFCAYYGGVMNELRDLFGILLENAIEMIIIQDKNGIILYSNSGCNEELGYEQGLVNHRVVDVIPEELELENGYVAETMVYRKNRTCFSATVKVVKLDEYGDKYGLMLNNESYKNSLEKTIEKVKQEAEASAKVKNEFVANVTHELRTPVNGILGNTNILLETENDSEKLHMLRTIETGCKTMNNLINNILDFSKLEAGKFTLEQRKFEFRSMIDYVRSTHMPKITEKGLKFFVTVSPEIPEYVIGDELRIGQVLNNLLSNAFKYTEKGEIVFSVKCINQDDTCNLIMSVKDTGKGIKSKDINKLFNKFERLDVEMNSTTEGTGLGLAITKNLVEMMGGKINVQSRFGEGSMFMVRIPQKIITMSEPIKENASNKIKNEKSIETTNLNKQDETNNSKYKNKKILIVDDNKLNIKVARRALQDFNFEIDECYDGQECLNKVTKGNEYDLILMDIMMPNMSGKTAIKKLKENPNFNIPTIALTADAIVGAEEKYITDGFVDYIAKPFSKEQIEDKIYTIFNNPSDIIEKKNNK